jgi:hypothetical protein
MVLYNKPLEEALVTYVKDNRDANEYLSLRLMRIYKITKLLDYHSYAIMNSEKNLKKLSEIRVDFWLNILNSILKEKIKKKDTINKYKISRDNLRSNEEKNRQKKLNQI